MKLTAVRCLAAAALCTLLDPALADKPLWELGLGMAGLRLPHYRGSDQSQTLVLPLPYAVYRGKILRADREGARAVLFETERLDFDVSAAASAPIRSDDNEARSGMPDLAPTLELGPNLNMLLARGATWKVDLRVPLHAAITVQRRARDAGWSSTPHVNLDTLLAGWNLGMNTGPVLGSRRFFARVYDVAPEQATATRPVYRSEAGYGGWQATLGASRRFGDWWTGAFVRADNLKGASFADSPLVRRENTVTFGLAVSWVFAASSQRVPDPD
jgi:MipA family protein